MKGAKPTVWRKMKGSQHRREGAEGLAEAAGLDEKGKAQTGELSSIRQRKTGLKRPKGAFLIL